MGDSTPISHLALEVGTPVLSSSGAQIGTVEQVVQFPDKFLAIHVRSAQGLRYVESNQITSMTTMAVHCSVTDAEAAVLPEPSSRFLITTPAVTAPAPDHCDARIYLTTDESAAFTDISCMRAGGCLALHLRDDLMAYVAAHDHAVWLGPYNPLNRPRP